MKQFLRFSEKLFVIVSLLLFTGAIAPFISASNLLHPVKEVLPNICLVVTLLLIVARYQRVLNIVVKEKFLWILVGVALASPLWSDTPMLTLEYVVPLARVTIFGVYFATCFSMREQLQLLTWMFGLAGLLCLLFGLALPSYGVVGMGFIANLEDVAHTGAWRGIYIHKNTLGNTMILSAITFFLSAIAHPRFNRIMWIGFGMSILLILKSTTKTALVVILVVLLLIPLYKALRWNYTKALPLFIITVLAGGSIAILLVSSAESILNILGRDITLTGRTEIWPAIVNKIQERPWLGYGYETFWLAGWDGETADVWRELKWGFEPSHAHNGFLELYLELGILGLGIFTLSFLSVTLRALKWAREIKSGEGLMPLVYLTPLVLLNLTESLLMRSNIHWLLYVIVTISMHHRINKLSVWHLLERKGIQLAYNEDL